jgi:hypothetical protein
MLPRLAFRKEDVLCDKSLHQLLALDVAAMSGSPS